MLHSISIGDLEQEPHSAASGTSGSQVNVITIGTSPVQPPEYT